MPSRMGLRNYLIEGVSGTGKTSVCHELRRRGHHALNGDRDLIPNDGRTRSPWGPEGARRDDAERAAWAHGQHVWDMDKVRSYVADERAAVSFFCGGSRNHACFIDLFDGVFVLDVDRETLQCRLAVRPEEEFGGRPVERQLILRLHETRQDIPSSGVVIDATVPVEEVVDEILRRCG